MQRRLPLLLKISADKKGKYRLKKYYAVRSGRIPGIYESWAECKAQTDGYSGAEFKSFSSREEAIGYITGEEQKPFEKSALTAYIDGSFSKEAARFSFGAVIFYEGDVLEFYESFDDPELIGMWNVAGEIKGAEFVFSFCREHGIKNADIYYDYAGIEKWCTGEWKANRPGTVRYKEYYNEISKNTDIRFFKVKGHSGDKYNDLADSLAKKALGIEK